MEINEYILKIKDLDACEEAISAAKQYKTSQELWLDCKRGDWMLWLVGKFSGEPGCEKRKKLVLTACKCARLALPYVQTGEERPLKAIETTEQWARGENGVTLENVEAAAYAVANAAANAAFAAKEDTLKQCADIVRVDYPEVDDLFLKG